MNLKTLREMRDAAPFKPFDIHLTDGRALRAATPDHFFFMPKSTEFLVVLPEGGFSIVESSRVVSVGRTSPRAQTH